MAWPDLPNLASGSVAVEAVFDAIQARLDHLGAVTFGLGTAAKDITGAAGLPAPDYDSDWFSAANNTTYTKPHSLSVTPGLVIVLHSTTATPGASDEVIQHPIPTEWGMDQTNVYVETGATWVIDNARRQSNAGYLRILAYEVDVS